MIAQGNIAISGELTGGVFNSSDQVDSDFHLAAGHFSSKFDMAITYPRPAGETHANTAYKVAYTGERYRIPVGVFGGAYPFKFRLVEAPSGMTIGQQLILSGNSLIRPDDYGIMNWENPVAGAHPVELEVTDQLDVVRTISFTITVSTNWNVLNTAALTNGSGSMASPFNNLASITDNRPVLVLSGTVDWEQKDRPLDDMSRTWIAREGANVIMKQALSSIGNNPGEGDFFFSGFELQTPADRTAVGQLFRLEGATRTVFFENTFNGMLSNLTQDPIENASILMWTNQQVAEADDGNAWYCLLHSNTFDSVKDRDLFLGYSMRFTVIENNKMVNCKNVGGTGQGFYPKTNVSDFCFRDNYTVGDGNTQRMLRVDAYVDEFAMSRYDITRNSVRYFGTVDGALSYCHEFLECDDRYAYFNTVYAPNAPAFFLRGTDSGFVADLENNVLITNSTNTNGVSVDQFQGTISNVDYLAGNVAAGIVNSSNKLTGSSIEFIGTRGAQVL